MQFPTEDFPTTNPQKYHGWFSQKQSNCYIYLNEKGEEITVTEVTKTAAPSSKWDDLEYKGVMVKFVKSLGKVPRPYDRIAYE